AVPTPIAINVNMLRLRLTIEAQPRWKNGQPPQRATGVARASCNQFNRRGEKLRWTGCPGIKSDMARKAIGRLSATEIQNRRFIWTSSGLACSSKVTVLGSSAMPQIGHEPGSWRTISGCMGQTYSVLIDGAAGAAGSKAMPHFGHAPPFESRTSGSIGQT